MRVGLVCPYSLSVPGGVQGQVLGLGRALRHLGVEARVLAPCDGPPPDVAVTPLGASVPTASNGSTAPIAPDPAATLRTIRALHDEAFDLVHLHEPLVPGPTLTALMLAEAPRIGTFHRAGGSVWYRRSGPLARWAARRLSVRCAVSESARATAHAALGGCYQVVGNGVDVAAIGATVPVAHDWPVVLFVGRHEPRKGLAVLLDAMKRLDPTVHLWVAGDGPQSRQLRHAALGDPRIEWLGVITEEEKRRRLRGADVVCAPSLHGESFGVVLLEAMAASTPVVASDLPGYRQVVRAGRDALLVAPGDPQALATALRRALTKGAATRAMVASASQQVQRFSLHQLARRYLVLYEHALSRRPPAHQR